MERIEPYGVLDFVPDPTDEGMGPERRLAACLLNPIPVTQFPSGGWGCQLRLYLDNGGEGAEIGGWGSYKGFDRIVETDDPGEPYRSEPINEQDAQLPGELRSALAKQVEEWEKQFPSSGVGLAYTWDKGGYIDIEIQGYPKPIEREVFLPALAANLNRWIGEALDNSR